MPRSFEGNAARKQETPKSEPRQKRSAEQRAQSDERMRTMRRESSQEDAAKLRELGLGDAEAAETIEEHERKREAQAEDPAKIAQRALDRYETTFHAAMNKGSLNPEMQQDLVEQLRAAKHALENKQEWLMHGSVEERKTMQANWNLIKTVESKLEVANQAPEDALQSYSGEVNAEKLSVRQGRLETTLKKISANVEQLSQQLSKEYGITPEEMIAGGSPKGFGAKMKFWMRRLTGSQELMEKWRAARAQEDEIIEELRSKASQATRVPSPIGRAGVARGRQNEAVELGRIEGRQAARDVREASREASLPVYGSELEEEYLGSTDEEMAKQSEEAMESDFAKQTKARIKEQALAKKQQEAQKAQELEERIDRTAGGKLAVARRGSDVRLATTKEIAERLKLEQLSSGELPGEEAEALKAEIGTEFAVMRRSKQKAEAPEMTPEQVEAKVQAERGRLGWEPSSEFPDREAMLPPEPTPEMPKEQKTTDAALEAKLARGREANKRLREQMKAKSEIPAPPPEMLLKTQELQIDRASEILPNAPQLWDLAYKNMTSGAAKNIDELESSKVMQGKNENAATKFVYLLARFTEAKNAGLTPEQLLPFYLNAEKAAAMLKLNNNPAVKNILGKKPFAPQANVETSSTASVTQLQPKKRSSYRPKLNKAA